MSQGESDRTNGPRPTASETYVMVTARLMQGLAIFLALAFFVIALWSFADITRRYAYFELVPLLGFGAVFLGVCAGFWAIGGFLAKKVRLQLADPDRPD